MDLINEFQNEIDVLKREKKIYDAHNELFEMFIDMARSSSESQVLSATIQKTLEIASKMAGAEQGSIFLLNAHGVVTDSILTRNQISGRKRSSLIGRVLDKGLAGWVKDNLKVGLVTNAKDDSRWVTFKDQAYVVSSALAVPIMRYGKLFGIITLLHSEANHFDPVCVDIIQKAANQMALIIENAQLYKKLDQAGKSIKKYSQELQFELDQGRKIQKDFLPSYIPQVDRCEIFSYFSPAFKLSGDFFDLLELPMGNLGFAVGDVSGKGVGSSLFMALARSLLHIFSGVFNPESVSKPTDDIEFSVTKTLKAVPLINEYIAKEHCRDGMFVTLFFCVIDPDAGIIHYINAGHEPVLVVGKDGVKKSLEATGPILGPLQTAEYEIKSFQMESGDMIFGFTDGVIDARSEEKTFYSRERLVDLINTECKFNKTNSVQTLIEAITRDIFSYIGSAPQSDDITMLAVQWQ